MNRGEERQPAVAVRSVEQEDCLVLALGLRGHTHKLRRPKEETLGKTLKRMSLVASKPETKARGKKKWRKEENHSPIEAHLYSGSGSGANLIPDDTPNSEAWVDGNVLVIGSDHYNVQLNPPAVLELRMPECCMAGYPIVPQVEVEFTDPFSCTWVWRRYPSIASGLPAKGPQSATNADTDSTSPNPSPLPDIKNSTVVSRSFTYWPSEDDYGHQLVVECTPATKAGRRGIPAIAFSSPVFQGPVGSPIAKRHLLTPGHLPGQDQLRMLTYNILADRYATSNFARTKLYPYCDPSALNMEYRECLVVQELLGYHADIVCLQEVDMKSFHRFIYPAMKEKGYEGKFCRKAGQIPEGEAIFTNSSKFAVVSTERIVLREFLQSDPSCSSLLRELGHAPSLLQGMLTKHTILLVTFLECLEKPGHYLCVANTHLYFHPLGVVIKLLQVEIIFRAIHSLLETFRQSVVGVCDEQSPKIAVALAGDFNSCPCIAPYNYVVMGSFRKEDPEWMSYRSTEVAACGCLGDLGILSLEDEEEEVHKDTRIANLCTSEEEEDVRVKALLARSSEDEQEDELGGREGMKEELPANERKSHEPASFIQVKDGQEADLTEQVSHNEATVWPRRTRNAPAPDTFEGLDLSHNFHLSNATGTTHSTNIAGGFRGVLDYIFIDLDHLEVQGLVPFPPLEELTQFVALPSVYFSSDHLAVIADIQWKDYSN